jgi:rhodanese-related sulfurtransferase
MLTRRLVLLVSLVLPLAGCDEEGGPAKVTVDQLTGMMESDEPPAVFDANGDKVRQEYGIIPGAKLLSDASDYDIAATLPSDKAKQLVFYCSSSWCTAAKTAARRAQAAGYMRAGYLPVGIKGWKSAGNKTEPVAADS